MMNPWGSVKFRTGGKTREPIGRSGAIPESTVKVWMGKDVFLHIFQSAGKSNILTGRLKNN